jgi:hypothetical protein
MTDTTLPTRTAWKITWRNKTYTEADISGAHFAILCMVTGRDDVSMTDLDPFVYDTEGEVSDVHGMALMMLLQMFVSQDLAEQIDTTDDPDQINEGLQAAIVQAIAEIGQASMADEILPSLSFDS